MTDREAFATNQINIEITLTNGTVLTNEDISENSLIWERVLSDDNNITIGKCNPAMFSVDILSDSDYPLKNQKIIVKINVTDSEDVYHEKKIGTFYVYSNSKSQNKLYRNILAYDRLYYLSNVPVIDWLSEFNSTYGSESYTFEEVRESFFDYYGLDDATPDNAWVQDDFVVTSKNGIRTGQVDSYSARDFLQIMCEFNGGNGYINEDDEFYMICGAMGVSHTHNILKDGYAPGAVSIEDYSVASIGTLKVKYMSAGKEYTASYESGSSGQRNVYTISQNPFMNYLFNGTLPTAIYQRIYNNLIWKSFAYKPMTGRFDFVSTVELGDTVNIEDIDGRKITTSALKITVTGLPFFSMQIESKGDGTYSETQNLSTANLGTMTATEVQSLAIPDKISLEEADIKYAAIDFANINTAQIDTAILNSFFAESGYINRVVSETGEYTDYLRAVKIEGDVIEANTISAKSIILRNETEGGDYKDGLIWQINAQSGDLTQSQLTEEQYRQKIDGSDIVARSITANQITASNIQGASGWINLAQGTFNYGGKLTYDGSTLYVNADNINLNGKVTFSDFASSLQSDYNSISSNASTALSTANEIESNVYYGNTTKIDGGNIYTGTIKADAIDVEDLFAQTIESTGSIKGGMFQTAVSDINDWAALFALGFGKFGDIPTSGTYTPTQLENYVSTTEGAYIYCDGLKVMSSGNAYVSMYSSDGLDVTKNGTGGSTTSIKYSGITTPSIITGSLYFKDIYGNVTSIYSDFLQTGGSVSLGESKGLSGSDIYDYFNGADSTKYLSFVTNNVSGSVSVTKQTVTPIASISLSPGVYILYGTCRVPSQSSVFMGRLMFSNASGTTDSYSRYTQTAQLCGNGQITHLQVMCMIHITSTATWYLKFVHNYTSSVTLTSGTIGINGIKIGKE